MKTRLLLALVFALTIAISIAGSVAISDRFFDDVGHWDTRLEPTIEASAPCGEDTEVMLLTACRQHGGEACTEFMKCFK